MANTFLADSENGTESSETQSLEKLSAFSEPQARRHGLPTAVKKGLPETCARKLPSLAFSGGEGGSREL